MSAESIRRINAGITRTGGEPIADVDDGGAEANAAAYNYEDVVQAELCIAGRVWKFARKDVLLSKLPGAPSDTDWDSEFQLPEAAELLSLHTVIVSGKPIDYEVHGQKILCDEDGTTSVYAIYTYRAPEDVWPPDFRMGITKRMEAIFHRANEDHNAAADCDDRAEVWFARAKTQHSQSIPPRRPIRHDLLDARRTGYAPRRSR